MSKISLAPWQFLTLTNKFDHFAMFGGVAIGKTFTGAHFALQMMTRYPDLTGFIGANSYNQLSQATLRELFYWLDYYGFDYVIDRLPPREWGDAGKKRLKSYSNVLSVRIGNKVATVFTRVLSDGNPIRGVEFSWYWLDESRDTPQETHDIILSRMRESGIAKGVITTTPNGEDWTYERFCLGNDGTGLYGAMHVPTHKSVEYGIITQKYYDTMRKSYSELMAQQELDAMHVNVKGGRAYYSASAQNALYRAPWGDVRPNPDRPLIVGCDFNFQPAPCVWMVGQVGPDLYGPNGEWWGEHIHWFGEIAEVEASTPFMAECLVNRYPGFFYRIYGDSSGVRGTTSNAGEHDYNQIAATISDMGHMFTIDVDQSNPLVRNRVENMCRLFRDSMGLVRQTYNPSTCPLFDSDTRKVGWKQNVQNGRGKLDDGGDVQLTHATDGAGYAVWKLFPFGRRGYVEKSIPSGVRSEINDVLGGR